MKYFLTPLLLIGSLSVSATLSYAQGGSAEKPTPTPKPAPTPRDRKPRVNDEGGRREGPSVRALARDLIIFSNPPGCAVWLGDKRQGVTDSNGHFKLHSLMPGTHEITLRRPNYRDERRTVYIEPDKNNQISITLSPLPGRFSVNANERGARFEIGADVYNEAVAAQEVAPGRYTVRVSKPGFRTEERTFDVLPGNLTNVVVVLSPLTPDQMLPQCEQAFQTRRYGEAAATCRTIVAARPDHARAHQLLGLSLYYTGYFAESVEPLAQAVRLGQEVVLPIKHHHRGANMGLDDALCEGKLTLSRNGLSFNSLNAVGHDFTAPYQKLQEIKPENFKGGRLNIKVSLPEGKGEKRKDYNFHVWQTQLVNTAQPGNRPLMNVNCRDQSCDAAVQMLYQLLMRLKQS